MAQITKEQQDQNQADFKAQFDAPDVAKTEPTEDEAFGLGPEPGAAGEAGAEGGEGAGTGAAAPEPSDKEKELIEREAALNARQQELDSREAGLQSTNVDETQSSTAADAGGTAAPDGGGGGGEGEGEGAGADTDDPAAALEADFGPEFVTLLGRFIEMKCKDHLGAGLTGIQSTVESVIEHLTNQSQQEHFKAIKAAHDDFQEVVASSEFEAYRAAQAPAEQGEIDRVVASGSATEIIDMLSKFKGSKEVDGQGMDGSMDAAADAAAGVRSSGLTLPPAKKDDGDYMKAWNEH